MKFAWVAASIALMFCSLSFASTNLGEFTCPSGEIENTTCAASCCVQNGGAYSYADEACTVGSDAQWSAAMACEQQNGCCIPFNDSPPGGACCCLPGLVLAGAFLSVALFARG